MVRKLRQDLLTIASSTAPPAPTAQPRRTGQTEAPTRKPADRPAAAFRDALRPSVPLGAGGAVRGPLRGAAGGRSTASARGRAGSPDEARRDGRLRAAARRAEQHRDGDHRRAGAQHLRPRCGLLRRRHDRLHVGVVVREPHGPHENPGVRERHRRRGDGQSPIGRACRLSGGRPVPGAQSTGYLLPGLQPPLLPDGQAETTAGHRGPRAPRVGAHLPPGHQELGPRPLHRRAGLERALHDHRAVPARLRHQLRRPRQQLLGALFRDPGHRHHRPRPEQLCLEARAPDLCPHRGLELPLRAPQDRRAPHRPVRDGAHHLRLPAADLDRPRHRLGARADGRALHHRLRPRHLHLPPGALGQRRVPRRAGPGGGRAPRPGGQGGARRGRGLRGGRAVGAGAKVPEGGEVGPGRPEVGAEGGQEVGLHFGGGAGGGGRHHLRGAVLDGGVNRAGDGDGFGTNST